MFITKYALIVATAFAALGIQPVQASSYTYGFSRITNTNPESLSSQLSVVVSDDIAGGATFKFLNNVGITSSITDIYFDDTALNLLGSITLHSQSAGVSFNSPATPPSLPGGNVISFTATDSGDSTPGGGGVLANGVNSSTEWLIFSGLFSSGSSFANLLAAMDNGNFRTGVHVQGIGSLGKSDSYVSPPPPAVPLPAAAWLFGSALIGFVALSNRRKV